MISLESGVIELNGLWYRVSAERVLVVRSERDSGAHDPTSPTGRLPPFKTTGTFVGLFTDLKTGRVYMCPGSFGTVAEALEAVSGSLRSGGK